MLANTRLLLTRTPPTTRSAGAAEDLEQCAAKIARSPAAPTRHRRNTTAGKWPAAPGREEASPPMQTMARSRFARHGEPRIDAPLHPVFAACLAMLAAPLAAQGPRSRGSRATVKARSRPGPLERTHEEVAAEKSRLAHGQRARRGPGALDRARETRYDARRPLDDAPPPGLPAGPGRALYRQGREAMNKEDWRWPAASRSPPEPPALALRRQRAVLGAFARYRTGPQRPCAWRGRARHARSRYRARAPAATRQARGPPQGELARQGDSRAAKEGATTRGRPPSAAAPATTPSAGALNALCRWTTTGHALLRSVMARRDAARGASTPRRVTGVAEGRRRGEDVLAERARTAQRRVRGQAVFWLSQTGTERALDAIEQILPTRTPRSGERGVRAPAAPQHARASSCAPTPSATARRRQCAIRMSGRARPRRDASFPARGLSAPARRE